jgi:hypothetical protein
LEVVSLDTAALSERRRELQARAEQQGVDLQAGLRGLPLDDDGLILGALATLLGLNIMRAFDEGVDLDELTRFSEERRAEQLTPEMVERYTTELRETSGSSVQEPGPA